MFGAVFVVLLSFVQPPPHQLFPRPLHTTPHLTLALLYDCFQSKIKTAIRYVLGRRPRPRASALLLAYGKTELTHEVLTDGYDEDESQQKRDEKGDPNSERLA